MISPLKPLLLAALALALHTACTKSDKGPNQSSKAGTAQTRSPVKAPKQRHQRFIKLTAKVIPSVVNISTYRKMDEPYGPSVDDLFKRFLEPFFRGRPGIPRGKQDDGESVQVSLGSGMVIDGSGLILTNAHVVAGAEEIRIMFTEDIEEEPTIGEVVGTDPELDLALIEVKTERKLVPLKFGDSDRVQVGEFVMAAGNPIGHGHSVSHGIVSAKGREAPFPLARYIQTDAPINPGNSGGPLVNLDGEIIGINNAIDTRAQGIGFAIPSNLVKKALVELKDQGHVARGFFGVLVEDLSPELAEQFNVDTNLKAPFVTHVFPKGPANQSGIRTYDILTHLDGKRISSASELIQMEADSAVGSQKSISVLRKGKKREFKIDVKEKPGTRKIPRTSQKKKKRYSGADVDLGMEVGEFTYDLAKKYGLSAREKGLIVIGTDVGGPAEVAGIMEGDVILEINQRKVEKISELEKMIKKPGSYMLKLRKPAPSQKGLYAVVMLKVRS